MQASSGVAALPQHPVRRRALAALRHLGLICIPFLLAAAPLLSFYRDNQTEVELGALWWPLLLLALIAAALYGLLWLILRDGPKASVLASLVTVWFHFYGDYNWALWAWTLLFVALGALVVAAGKAPSPRRGGARSRDLGARPGREPHKRDRALRADNPGLSSSDPNVWPTSLATPTVPSGARKPDIYVLCPDDYARHDVLAHYFHYDNGPFLRQLERRGFVVSPESRSPYSDSEANIAAEMNMDYLSRLPHILGPKSEDSRPVRRLIQDNRASRILKELGYRYVHIDTDEVTWGQRNPHISHVATPDSFMSLWLADRTVLKKVGGWPGFNQTAVDQRFRDTIRSQFAALDEVPPAAGAEVRAVPHPDAARPVHLRRARPERHLP